MGTFTVVDTDGRIKGSKTLPEGAEAFQVNLVATPPPGPLYRWVNGAWQDPSVADQVASGAAQTKTAAIAVYTAKINASCSTSIGTVQCDETAQADVAAKVISANIAKVNGDASWTIKWRLTDNSWSSAMDADQMIAFGQQVEGYVEACDIAYWAVADAIIAAVAASSLTQLNSIDVNAGYPA